MQLEEAGVPTVLVATKPFEPMARGAAAAHDLADARIVVIQHPLGGIDEDAVRARGAAAVDAVRSLVTARAEASRSS
ncbi:MAG TPA: hypothetical protein VKH17_01160 [Acidimicrobiia bacterium]|nr:hypothetical protein [Acidimicrobiia bacterium]